MTGRLWLEQVERHHAPVVTSQLDIVGRPALLMHIELGGDHCVGEASPLEGFGNDSLAHARADLENATIEQVESAVSVLVQRFNEVGHCAALRAWEGVELVHAMGSPSARYCFEMLCARVAARACDTDLFGLLRAPGAAWQLSTSQVLDPLAPDFLARLLGACRQGVTTFKLKCGRNVRADIEALAQASGVVQSNVRFRLDANRAYCLEDAHVLLERLSAEQRLGAQIDWCEDLTDDPQEWASLEQYGVPLAVDEHLWRGVDVAASYAQVLVAKPMALGGMSRCYRLADWAASHQRVVCISHLFDGPWAFEATSALAFSVHSAAGAAGLSDHVGLGPPGQPRFPWLFPDRIIVPFSP